jgi:ABC-type amino acid transport substrate-binding protein
MKIRFLMYILIIFYFALPGCAPKEPALTDGDDSSPEQTLKVGITADAPPLIYKRNGEITGLEAELAKKFSAFLGKKIRFIEVKWIDQIPTLVSGKTDIIMSGMTITELRRMRINFSQPYLVTGQSSLVRRNEYNRFSRGLTDLLSPVIKIGTVKGTTGDFLVQQKIGRSNTMQYNKPQEGVKAVIDGKIDVFVYDLPMNFYFASLNEAKGIMTVPVPLSREYLAWGIRKEDVNLLKSANMFLEELRQNNQLQKMILKWIPLYRDIYTQ